MILEDIVTIVTTTRRHIMMHVNAVAGSLFVDYCVVDIPDELNFGTYLESFVQILLTNISRREAISPDKLAKCWGVWSDSVKVAVEQTTQRGVCITANPALFHRFRANDCMLSYRCLHHPVFTNIMFSNTYSSRNNKCMQVFVTDMGVHHDNQR